MTSRRITRLQSRRSQEFGTDEKWSHRGRNAGKGNNTASFDGGRNMSSAYSGVTGRRSFPMDPGTNDVTIGERKVSKTDTTTKQKRTLAERTTNTFTNEKLAKIDDTKTDIRCQCDTDSLVVPVPRSTPWVIGNTSDDTLTDDESGIDTVDNIHHDECDLVDLCDEAMFNAETLIPVNSAQALHCSEVSKNVFPPNESPMDFQSAQVDRRPRQLPNGVTNIDDDWDSLDSSQYSGEIMTHLMERERDWMLAPDFLSKSPDVTPKMRGVLMDWLIQVQAHEELKEETLHLSVLLIDRFLSTVETHMPKLQLVGITCLLIASKFVERFAPEISTLCHLTDNTFRLHQVIRYEVVILKKLDFCLLSPVCTTFLDRFLQVNQEDDPPLVGLLARYLLDLTVTNHSLATARPSLLAAGALYLARRLVLRSNQVWGASLQHYTTYRQADLVSTVNELANMLFKAPNSKFQGTRSKYNSEKYSFVSQSEVIRPENIILHFETTQGTAV